MNDAQITISGNLVDVPELRFTPAGHPVAKFRVAQTPRYLDKASGEWKENETLFLTCNVWRQAAENAAGMRVIVTGTLRQRSYEGQDGARHTTYELTAEDFGPSLRNASAKVTKAARTTGPDTSGDWASEPAAGEPPF